MYVQHMILNLNIERLHMSKNVMNAANTAIFYFQFNTNDAVRFVIRNTKVDSATAQAAIKETLTGYKKK